jgi:hypothetical protein
LDRCGLLNSELFYRPDYEFWLRLEAAGAKFAQIDQVLAGRRLHAGNNRAESGKPEAVLEVVRILSDLFGQVSAKWYLTYGQLQASELGFDREDAQEFDRVVLRHARDPECVPRSTGRLSTRSCASLEERVQGHPKTTSPRLPAAANAALRIHSSPSQTQAVPVKELQTSTVATVC